MFLPPEIVKNTKQYKKFNPLNSIIGFLYYIIFWVPVKQDKIKYYKKTTYLSVAYAFITATYSRSHEST